MDNEVNMQNIKETIQSLLLDNVKRDGIDKLVEWLEKSDFFKAPASTHYHLACEGGLARHSLNVYNRLVREVECEYGTIDASPWSRDTLVVSALLHDLCKVDFYTIEMRNKKDESGTWVKVPYYTINDKLPISHGAKSQYIAGSFIKLTREESVAIISHMGGFDNTIKGGDYTVGKALEMFPLALLLHIADLKASNIDEVENDQR